MRYETSTRLLSKSSQLGKLSFTFSISFSFSHGFVIWPFEKRRNEHCVWLVGEWALPADAILTPSYTHPKREPRNNQLSCNCLPVRTFTMIAKRTKNSVEVHSCLLNKVWNFKKQLLLVLKVWISMLKVGLSLIFQRFTLSFCNSCNNNMRARVICQSKSKNYTLINFNFRKKRCPTSRLAISQNSSSHDIVFILIFEHSHQKRAELEKICLIKMPYFAQVMTDLKGQLARSFQLNFS